MERPSQRQRLALVVCLLTLTGFWCVFGLMVTRTLGEPPPGHTGSSDTALSAGYSAQQRIVWWGVGLGWITTSGIVLGAFAFAFRGIEGQIREMEELSLQLVTSMVNAVDAQNPWTRGHSERTARYALRIGRRMGLDQETLDDLWFASLLHDVGSIGHPDNVPDTAALAAHEGLETITPPAGRGGNVLQVQGAIQFRRILPLIRAHRERYDGTGYPDAREGEKIPLLSRIIHVSEAYDAMVDDRPYRTGSGPTYAREELIRHSGTQFDPKVVDAFLKILAREKGEARKT